MMINILITGVLLCILSLIGFLRIKSPGRLKPLVTADGQPYSAGLAEKQKLTIGGVEQGLFILSENHSNPVLLFLHGGPGSPELPLIYNENQQYRLESEFTVCYWDQRGAGMSFKNVPESSMTLEQFIADTIEVTRYLKERFNQEKIFIMGHSWGSYLGVKTISQAPEHYHAYIGIGQISHEQLSEKLAYEYMLEHAKHINDKRTLKKLQLVDPNAKDFPSLSYTTGIRTSAMNDYGIGITREKESLFDLIQKVFLFEGYSLGEKVNFLQGSLFSLKFLFDDMLSDDLRVTTNQFKIPVYITHGKFDYQVSYELAKVYYEQIQAPKKDFFTFENSAHSPIIEERQQFLQVVRKIKEDTL